MSATGSIYDLGYRGYDGPRFGRASVALGLLRQTLKEAFGIGRGGRAKVAPFTLLILNTLPALLAVGFNALTRQAGAADALDEVNPIQHDAYWSLTSTLVMLFCAAQAPELFGRDQRYGVLPLYFSRVLTRVDYALARTGGLFIAILIVTVTPQLLLSVGAILAAADPDHRSQRGAAGDPALSDRVPARLRGLRRRLGAHRLVHAPTRLRRRLDHRPVHRPADRGRHHRRRCRCPMSPVSSSSPARATSSTA